MIDAAAKLRSLGSATLGESGASRMSNRLRAVWPGAQLAAPAYCVSCAPGDNLGVHVGVAAAPAGSVLVVSVGGVYDLGYWGEVLTTAAETRGIAGLVIDGCVRDVDALAAHGFPVFSAGIALTGATKDRVGSVGLPVTAGEVHVDAGDWIVGDADGVVVVPHATLTDVLMAARARTDKEAGLFTDLQAGLTTLDLLGLDPTPIDHP